MRSPTSFAAFASPPGRRAPAAVWSLLSLAAVAGLAGCAVASDPDLTAAPEAAAARAARSQAVSQTPALQETALPADWWRVWRDEALSALQTEAAQASPDLQLAAARLAQSQAELGLVDAADAPQLGLDAGYSRAAISANSPLAALGAYTGGFNTFSLGLQASWELDLWGHQRQLSAAAQARSQAALAGVAAARVSLSAELARQYWLLRGVQAQQALLEQQLVLCAEQLRLSESRQRNGVAGEAELAAARAELAGLQAQLPGLQRQQQVLANSLALLLGRGPRELDERLRATAAALPDAPQQLPIGLSSELARQRPDIRQAEARLQAAVADIGAAQADFYPRVSLGAGLGVQAFQFKDLGSWDSRQFGIGPQLHLPIFEGGRLKQALALSQARHREAAVAYQTTVLRAWHEVDDALGAYRAELARQARLREVAAQQQTALHLAERARQQGVADQRSVLGARRAWLGSQAALADSQTAAALAVVGLYRALGGGWSGELQTALVPQEPRS